MKKVLIAAALVATGASAQAADLPVKAAPYYKAPVAKVYDWTGFYFGVNAGTALDRSLTGLAINSGPGSAMPTDRLGAMGAMGGAQIGYNWQYGNFLGLGNIVLGVEADIQGTGVRDDRTCVICTTGGAFFDQKLDWFGTARGRVGLATGPVLSYLTGGFAYGGASTTITPGTFAPVVFSGTRSGWTVGSGVEAALGGNWTGKIEYLYIDLGSQAGPIPAGPGGTVGFSSEIREHIFRAGLNYRLGPNGTYVPEPLARWAGFYAGGNFGGATAMNRGTLGFNSAPPVTENLNVSPNGYNGGGQIGYNWQAANWVIGAEADFQGSSQRDDKTCMLSCVTAPVVVATSFDQKMQWFGTARARVGYAIGSTLFYATGGLAYGNVSTRISGALGGFPFDSTFSSSRAGYAVGGGIESPFTLFGLFGPHWTAKTEYLFVDLGRVTDSIPVAGTPGVLTYSTRVQEQILRTGLNYHFNEPVVAKY